MPDAESVDEADPLAGFAAWTQAERDAAYNNNLAVPNSPALIEDRNRRSAAMRLAQPAGLDIPYGPRERNRFDLFPAADPAAPCFVFIHGGYWQRNSRDDFAMLAEGFGHHGWATALPGYTLAPDVPLTAIVAEIGASLDWLAADGPRHGIAGPIVVGGWSAGAQLAAITLAHPSVRAGLAISGVFDLAPIRQTYLDEKLNLTDREIAELSPLRLPVVPKPLAIAYGTRELPALVRDSRRLHAMRAAAHAPGPLWPVASADHFSILDALRRPDGELTRLAMSLIG